MVEWAIHLFGKLRVEYGNLESTCLVTGKAQELLAYLLLHRHRTHHRETLAGLLWENNTRSQSLKHLRQVIWQLQSELNKISGKDSAEIMLVDTEWIGLNPDVSLWLDVALFERAFEHARETPGCKLDEESVGMLQDAVELYQGDLLEGDYSDWCLYERELFQNMYLNMLGKLIGFCEACREYETGIAYGNRILEYERAHESTHRHLMRLYYLAGNRTAALRQYERCLAALKEELDVRPTRSTSRLYEQIKADNLLFSPTGERFDDQQQLLPELLHSLQQMQNVLAELQKQVKGYMWLAESHSKDQTKH